MTKGKFISLTPLAFALGSALSSGAFAVQIEGPYIYNSTQFDEDTVYVTKAGASVGSNRTQTPVEITIAEGKTLTLIETQESLQARVVDATSPSGLVFSGGNLILRRDDAFWKDRTEDAKSETEQFFIRASDGEIIFGGPNTSIIGGVHFQNAYTEMSGDIAKGIYLTSGGAASFDEGFVMNLDRSLVQGEKKQVEQMYGAKVDGGALVTGTNTEINMIAGVHDLSMRGLWILGGGDFQGESLTLNLDANNNNLISTSLTGLVVAGAAGKADLA